MNIVHRMLSGLLIQSMVLHVPLGLLLLGLWLVSGLEKGLMTKTRDVFDPMYVFLLFKELEGNAELYATSL
jgi:hypothetical protein